MKSVYTSTALSLLLSSDIVNAAAVANFPRASSGKGYLSIPVTTVNRPQKPQKRADNAFEQTLMNMDFFYAAQVGIGSPPQMVTVLVDTGSSELWVNPDCNTAPSQLQAAQCSSFGQYNPKKSKTPPMGPFGSEEIHYGDPSDETTHTSVSITYFTDDIAFGDAKITNQTFGVVTESEGQSQGIMGLAPDVQAGFDQEGPYSLVLNSMAKQGVINSRVFSLDLRHADAETGAVIYGGIDRSKFIGSLEKLPFVKGNRGEFRLAAQLNTMGVTNGKSRNFKLNSADRTVMLDSGTTISRMHPAVAQPILQALGARDDGQGYFYVPCSLQRSGGSVDFGFGQTTVRVPMKDFVMNVGNGQVCYVGLVLTTDQQILGDSVLRAGYFVFDWDNEAVHVAQAANCGDNDIVAVGKGTDSVPNIKGNCQAKDALFTGGSLTRAPGVAATRTDAAVNPTKAITSIATVTNCPEFDAHCKIGQVTTRTLLPAKETADISGGEEENAAATMVTSNWLILSFVTMAVFMTTF